jgi:hypothetical protein
MTSIHDGVRSSACPAIYQDCTVEFGKPKSVIAQSPRILTEIVQLLYSGNHLSLTLQVRHAVFWVPE